MAHDDVQREVVPIPDQDYMGQVLYDAKDPDVSRPAIRPIRPPAGAPNTRFHTTAICSPTRAALIAGRNHHMVGMGGITGMATSAPGYNSMRPNSCSPVPEILKLNGYSTAHFGKCHEVPVWESSPVGPFHHGRRRATASSTSSASWAARPISGIRR
jgi:arylsulfatase A-like enzyme